MQNNQIIPLVIIKKGGPEKLPSIDSFAFNSNFCDHPVHAMLAK